MKTLIVILVFLAPAFPLPKTIHQEEGCQICQESVSIMFKDLGGSAIDKEMHLLDSTICPQTPDPQGCQLGIQTWWPSIAAILYNDESASIVCNELSNGQCEPFASSKWNCETCIKDVVAVAEAYSSQEGTSHIITALDGTAFCESDWIGLDDEDQVRTCKHLIRVFMPLALDSMTDGLNATAKEACNSWFQDVCKK